MGKWDMWMSRGKWRRKGDEWGRRCMSSRGGRVEVWTWGKGEVGQLGHGDEEPRRSPARITSFTLPPIWKLALTQGVLSDLSSDLLSAGNDGSQDLAPFLANRDHSSTTKSPSNGHALESLRGYSRQGSSLMDVSTMSSQDETEVGISCGLFHSSLWTSEKLWLWGKGEGGRLGLGSEIPQYTPCVVPTLAGVKTVALGGLHSAAITNEGVLYTWGFGGFGALGHGRYSRELIPKQVMCKDWMGKVLQVAAGGAHMAAISESGDVYTCGRDEGEGRLGHGVGRAIDDGSTSLLAKVEQLPVAVAAVACGGFYTMALTPEGELWSWGGNSNYELGRGNRRDDWRPKPVPGFENTPICQIACGGYHSAALTDKGNILTWGHGGHGQLGHCSLESGKEPCVVEALADHKVVSVACGSAWTAAVTDSGELYTWGKNRDCQLGIPGLMDCQTTPRLVTFEDMSDGTEPGTTSKYQVLKVAAGATHGMCIVYRS